MLRRLLPAVALALTVGIVPTIARADLGSILKKTEVLFDEQIAVSAHGSQMRGFTMSSSHDVKLEVKGIKHTDKGFKVYVIKQSEWEAMKAGKEFKHVPEFHGLNVTGFTHTGTLPAGQWAVVIANTENIMNGMVASVKLTVDP